MLELIILLTLTGKTLTLRNVNMVDVTTGKIEKVDIVIEDSMIKNILPPGKTKDGIFLDSKYIIPGLIDAIVFLTRSPGGNVLAKEFSPTARRQNLYAFTLAGITTIVDAGMSKGWENEFRKEDDGFAPSIFFMGPTYMLPNPARYDLYPYDRWAEEIFKGSVVIIDKEKFREFYWGNAKRVRIVLASSFYKDPLTTYTPLLSEFIGFLRNKDIEPIAYVETEEDALFAKNLGIKFFAGYPLDAENILCSPCLVYFKAPEINYRDYELPEVIKSSLKIPFSFPNIMFNDSIREQARKIYRKIFNRAKEIKKTKLIVASSAGNPLLFPGYSLIDEMVTLTKAGISPLTVLQGVTIYASQFCHLPDRGIIKEGKKADLLVLNSNPLEDISVIKDPYLVIKKGRIINLPVLKWKMIYGKFPLSPWDFPPIFDDFDDGDRTTYWRTSYDDTLYTYGYQGKIEVVKDGANNSPFGLRITGELAQDYKNMWRAGVVIPFDPEGWIGIYTGGYSGLEFFTKGDGREYKLAFITDLTDNYQYPSYKFTAEPKYKKIYIPFEQIEGMNDAKLCALRVSPVGIGKGKFEMFIDELKFHYVPSNKEIIKFGKKLLELGFTLYDEDMLTRSVRLLERVATSGDTLAIYFSALANNRLGLYCRRDKKKAKQYFEQAKKILENSNWQSAERFALLGSIYGNLIGINQLSGVILSKKIDNYFKLAVEIAPDNPRVYYLLGLNKFFTPPMFGGGVDKAVDNFEKAKELFEQKKAHSMIDWGYKENLVWLGKAYKHQGKKEEAIKYFQLALKEDPYYSHAWWELIQIGD